MEVEAATAIGAGIACLGMGGAGIGLGNIFGSYLAGALRNPSAADGQFGRLIFGFAVTEALGIFSLLIALPAGVHLRAADAIGRPAATCGTGRFRWTGYDDVRDTAYGQETAGRAGRRGDDTQAGTEVPAKRARLFPPFDPSHTFPSQILWLAITFGLFYLFLKRVALPRVGSILEVRSQRIAQDLDQAARMKAEADAAVAAYEQELAEARAKANAIGQAASNAARLEAETKRKQIEAELEGKLSKAEARIAKIKSSALAEVSTIAADTAAAIVERLIGGKARQGDGRCRRQGRSGIGAGHGRNLQLYGR